MANTSILAAFERMWQHVVSALGTKSDISHSHDDKYYTETEIDTKLANKADSEHNHDSAYDAKGSASTALDFAKAYADQNKVPTSRTINGKALSENITLSASDVGALPDTTSIPDSLSDLSSDSTHRTVTDTEKATWNAKSNFSGDYNDLANKPAIPSISGLATETYVNEALADAEEYTDTKVSGLASTTTVDNKISSHNTETTAHNDIRLLIAELTTRVNTVLNSDDVDLDQMSEIVAYIKSNKSVIDSITTNKVNVADIINNLTTNVTNKPLSAAQGVTLKGLIDTLRSEFDLHGHEIFEVSGLQAALDDKAAASHGDHVLFSTAAPVVDGTASAGSASTVARSDHKHPTDTTRAAQADLTSHTKDTTVHITGTERTNWSTAYTHSQTAHAPSNAEKNQNAFSNIAVGSTTIAADTTTDTITLVAGNNITITPDATNDKITIAATDTDTHYKAVPHAGSSTSTTAAATTNGNTFINIVENGARSGGINIKGAGATTVSSDANGVITISSTDNNTTYNTGSATESGLTKLYTGTGSNTDGTMTQSAITSALNGKETSGAAAAALTNAKSYADSKVASLISSGTADPSASVTSQFYFKYATE